jgi:integrase
MSSPQGYYSGWPTMSGTSCLYRRPSGIYAVRLVVPKRLREFVGRTEIHTSTGLRSLDVAKAAALKIQLHWRERFLAMDTEKLRNESPLLAGDGMISVIEAADAIGLSHSALAGELLSDRAQAYIYVHARRCWVVPNLNDIDRDDDGTFIRNDVEDKGFESVHSGIVRFFDSAAALAQFVAGGNPRETVFRNGNSGAIFLEMGNPLEVTLSQCITSKNAVAQVRARLASLLAPAPAPPPATVVTVTAASAPAPTIFDPVTAKHGKKRFSELFELYKRDRDWGKDQTRRMSTEAGLFTDLMGDPVLGEIEKETVLEFARRLALLPSDIYQSKRRHDVASLNELIDVTGREGLARKNERTIKGHVGRISEILGYGVKAGMMRFNPASDFKRGRNAGRRAQDEREIFTPDELALIFSQDWFTTGAGQIARSGQTHWRPHYYWLPLLGLLTGGRINELAQLHLDDIRQTDAGVWYLDFNLNGSDKMDEPDKSLKTVNAVRVVPMHGDLVRLGLPEYVGTLRRAGYTRLFPELKRDAVKGYGKPAGSWFNERFLGGKLGIERNGMKTFHSLRHCFVTAAERLGLPERVLAQLAGHERGNTQSGTRYAKDRGADELAPNLAALNFPQLAGVAPFKIAEALGAIKRAERLKVSAAKRPIPSDGR